MERRDIIKDEIERLGRVLGKVLSILLGSKSTGDASFGIEKAEQTLRSELDIDVNELVQLPDEELLSRLIHEKKFTVGELEQLADIIVELGRAKGAKVGTIQTLYFQKALVIYENLTNTSSVYSLEWINKINRLKTMLN